jgi:uncharacterized membrane protein
MSVSASQTELFSGPVPPPQILAQYNAVIPGGAERLLAMAEEQSKHRMALERFVVESEARRADRGLMAGVLVAITGFVAATVMALAGQTLVAGIVSALDIAGLVGVFVYGTERRKQERAGRVQALTGR